MRQSNKSIHTLHLGTRMFAWERAGEEAIETSAKYEAQDNVTAVDRLDEVEDSIRESDVIRTTAGGVERGIFSKTRKLATRLDRSHLAVALATVFLVLTVTDSRTRGMWYLLLSGIILYVRRGSIRESFQGRKCQWSTNQPFRSSRPSIRVSHRSTCGTGWSFHVTCRCTRPGSNCIRR